MRDRIDWLTLIVCLLVIVVGALGLTSGNGPPTIVALLVGMLLGMVLIGLLGVRVYVQEAYRTMDRLKRQLDQSPPPET